MKCVVALLVAWGIATAALGQVPSSEEPGRIASRFETGAPAPHIPSGSIHLPQSVAPTGASEIGLKLVRVKIVGSTIYSAATLEALSSGLVGKTIRLSDLYALAAAITKRYGDNGYVLSHAAVVPQEIDPRHAVVTIKVSEAYIDRVEWPPEFSQYRDLFSGYAAKVTAERPSNISTVVHYLLLAGELPGFKVTSQFEASKTNPDASTLKVMATETPIEASTEIDNHGTEARGPWEYLISATFNNALHQHEALTATLAGSVQTKELTYGALGYRQVLTDDGLGLSWDLSYSRGQPGTAALEAVEFSSSSLAGDIGFSLPVVRTHDTKLTLSALAFFSDSLAYMLGSPSSDDRLRGIRAKADLVRDDDTGGRLVAEAVVSQGFSGFGASANGSPLLSRANGRADFTTLALTAAYDHPLGNHFSAHLAASGQLVATPLLSPEECGYGGKEFGRAFDPSEITGDDCVLVSGEVRFDPPVPDSPFGKPELYAFADYGRVFRIAPSVGTPTMDAGASAGFGARLKGDHYDLDLAAAKPLFGRAETGWRAFLSLSVHK